MLFWFVATAVVSVHVVFRDAGFDHRLLIVGAVIPVIGAVTGPWSAVLLSVLAPVVLLVVVMAVTSYLLATGHPDRKLLILVLASVWGVRLGSYMLWRWRDHGSDRRYVAMLGKAQERRGWSFAKASMRKLT